MKTYTIKPLEWHHSAGGAEASCVLGTLSVYRAEQDDGSFKWFWSYCFDEYYNEGYEECRTRKEGKEKAEALYVERIKQALEEVCTTQHQ